MSSAIIGFGAIGQALARAFARKNLQVTVASRRAPEVIASEAKAIGPTVTASSLEEALKAQIVILAVPFGLQNELAKAADWQGKIVIDATNPVLPDLSGLSLGTTTSAAEQVAQWASGAHVVKAFNTIGFNIMADPSFGPSRALLFYCGDDAAAKQTVKSLAAELGFDPQDAGPLRQARLLEPFALLWISLAYGQGYGRDFAFQLLRR